MRILKKANLIGALLLLGLLSSCGGPDICECQAEAGRENPDKEFMAKCEKMYEGKSFEEMEEELKACKEKEK